MLDFQMIQDRYPSKLHSFQRGMLREYLQYQILAIMFNHPNSRKLSFLGGTCLRMVYGLPRFSEDIDFDNKNLTEEEFEELSEYLQKELEKLGYLVELKIVNKGAFHCYIKFPDLLYEQKITPQKFEKILIQIDTFDQGVFYESDIFILDKFEFFNQIKVAPKSVILSQKLWTITQRPKSKGRDFYDVMFLLQNTQPNLEFLNAKFNHTSLPTIVDSVIDSVAGIDWKKMQKDVSPFLFDTKDSEKIALFPDFLKQKLCKL